MNRINSQVASKRPLDGNNGPYTNNSRLYARLTCGASTSTIPMVSPLNPIHPKFLGLSALHEDARSSTIVPPVTVVLEGRSICNCIYLNRHTSYESFAVALRRMFVDADDDGDGVLGGNTVHGLDLSNAVPGHLVAYEDIEDDLLLAGDLSWNEFVRVAKRIRIVPAKASRLKCHHGVAK